jgi:protein-tyrosine phosphatase
METSGNQVESMKKTKLLFVCMGNICRSPTAEGVMQKLIADAGLQHAIDIDSAGTHSYHVGASPDRRSQAAALQRGYDLSKQRSRQVADSDFVHFDLLLAMDKDNLYLLRQRCPEQYQHKLKLMMEFAEHSPVTEVPDPYVGGMEGFEHVLDYLEDACGGLLHTLRKASEK